ncbi:FeoA domain protein [Capnocytophaga sp. oral taxon 412 str. F0487]|uniref:FeoA family protein n=1 Tax=Capnocytophaga sp. oral taxon 412 TaxID=712218 RepID=UPI0002697326|nr:FeoA family protein [Capnocytophaga sp. oral taxon 412]EIW92316.1 FeoA domain protein [Capnocytophaga sp. oral taxon 412 str. F0487]
MEEVRNRACTVADLKKGEKGLIQEIDIAKIPQKLIDLGCYAGSEVEVLQKATFGDPIYIRMNEAFLSIRKDMAKAIELAN